MRDEKTKCHTKELTTFLKPAPSKTPSFEKLMRFDNFSIFRIFITIFNTKLKLLIFYSLWLQHKKSQDMSCFFH